MEVIRLGKRGQLSIPKRVLTELGLEGESVLLVETTDDGAIVLRPAGVYPIELYSEERIEEFFKANELTPDEEAKVRERLESLASQSQKAH
jgi:AbrB family looped-hinge helix DNA binding protein